MLNKKEYYKLPLLYLLIISLLTYGTGVISDDFGYLSGDVSSLFILQGNYINIPFAHLLQASILIISDFDNYIFVDIFKIIYLFISLLMISQFLKLFLNEKKSYFYSFLFIFFPIHDGSTYWIMGQYLILSCACLLYSYYWVINKKYGYAIAFVLIGSFLCYGSIAIILSLSVILLIQKKTKECIILIIPNFIYCIYYIYATEVLGSRESRLQIGNSAIKVIKSFVIQTCTFLDSTIGPSFILKIYYSITAISVLMGLGAIITIFIYKKYSNTDLLGYEKQNKLLIVFCISCVISNILMFSLTGRYPHLTFNIGNRVTTYSTFIFFIIFNMKLIPSRVKNGVMIILIFSIFGISSHWKSWSKHQDQVIRNLKNQTISIPPNEKIFVSGNQYSRLGPFSHIEFFSEHWVVDPIIKYTISNKNSGFSITSKRFLVVDEGLKDIKYGSLIELNEHKNFVYDSIKNNILILSKKELKEYINSLHSEKRHWLQLITSPDIINLLKKISPRLEYAL